MQEQIAELETRIAFQEQAIQELSDVVARQQTRIDRLSGELETLKEQLLALGPSAAGPDEDTSAPPY